MVALSSAVNSAPQFGQVNPGATPPDAAAAAVPAAPAAAGPVVAAAAAIAGAVGT